MNTAATRGLETVWELRDEVPENALPSRMQKALREPMQIRRFGEDRFIVETTGGTYVVDPDAETCTCADAAIRSTKCKHQHRVQWELVYGILQTADRFCAVCAAPIEDNSQPGLCKDHHPDSGEFVRDRETNATLIVIAITPFRADVYQTADGTPIAAYPSNAAYGDHEPVILATYARSVGPNQSIEDAPRYGFPASRIQRFSDARRAMRYPGVGYESSRSS